MKNKKPVKELKIFEQIKKFDKNGNEFWKGRDLAKILEYSEFRHFLPVINKAKNACKNSKYNLLDHFEDILEMVDLGSNAKREIEDIKLSRYACYLVVQNADPSKEIVALGQTYFALQARRQELADEELKSIDENKKRLLLRNELKEHNKKLVSAADKAGVKTTFDFAIFQNHGYQGLYGGLGAKEIHHKKQLKKSQNILDHMGSTELAANLFRATQTQEKLRRDNIEGKILANKTHFEVGKKVRQTIEEIGGGMPEDLPVVESVKKIKGLIEGGEGE